MNNILILYIILLYIINEIKKIKEDFITSTTDDAIKTTIKQIIKLLLNFISQDITALDNIKSSNSNKIISNEILTTGYYLKFPDYSNNNTNRPQFLNAYTNKNYGMFLNTYIDAADNAINDSSERNRCNVSINSWNGIQFKDTTINDTKIWFDLRSGQINSRYLKIVNDNNYKQEIILNGDNGNIECKNLTLYSLGNKVTTDQIADFTGNMNMIFSKAIRSPIQAEIEGINSFLQMAIPLINKNGFSLQYIAKSSYNNSVIGRCYWDGINTPTIINDINFGKEFINIMCEINNDKNSIILKANLFSIYISATITFM